MLPSSQIKVAMSFHKWHAALIIRIFFFSPLSVYLSISSSSKFGDLSILLCHRESKVYILCVGVSVPLKETIENVGKREP
jgi:hypothetical protein